MSSANQVGNGGSGELSIPILDFSGVVPNADPPQDLVRSVRSHAESVGFFVLVGHDVSESVVDRMAAETLQFFELPLDEKLRYQPGDERPIGYRPIETSSLAQEYQHGAPPDLMEVFRYEPYHDNVPPGVVSMRDLFPAPSMLEAWLDYVIEMQRLARAILEVFALALSLPRSWFEQFYGHPSYKQIANHYPAQLSEPEPGQLRAGAHTDYGVLTILRQAETPGGLEVMDRRTGAFVEVPHVPNSFVLNLGDLMAHWTNGRWASTLHRVVNPPPADATRRRLSLPFFFNPDEDAVIRTLPSCVAGESPTEQDSIRAGDWISRRRTAFIVDDNR